MYEHLPQIAGDHRRLANISRKLQEINRRLANISRKLQEINRRLANISRRLQGITVSWRTSPADCRSLLCPLLFVPMKKGKRGTPPSFAPIHALYL